MADVQELGRRVKKVFGRDVAPEMLQGAEARLTIMLRNVALLEEWQDRLHGIEPAAVHKTPKLDDLGIAG
jgi:hypothetical protein